MRKGIPVAIFIVLAGFGFAPASHADCIEQPGGNGTPGISCDHGAGGVQRAAFTQFARADMDRAPRLLTADESPYQYLANSGTGRYICTPSGFGQVATCRPRGAN